MLYALSAIRKSIFSPKVLVKNLWNHDYKELRLILEQADELHYFHVSADTQRFICRTLVVTVISLMSIIIVLSIHSSVSVWRYNSLEASKQEADKRRQEALTAIAALSDKELDYKEDISQEKLIKIAHEYRDRMKKMQVLIDFSSQELKLASLALEEGLKASGLRIGIINQIKDKVAFFKTGIGGNSEEVKFDDKNSQLLANYRNNLSQLEELKRVYQLFPTKTPADKAIITSKYGVRIHPITKKLTIHEGLDFIPTLDQNAKAVLGGVVEKVQHSNSGYGNMVVLLHPNQVRTIYAHLDSIQVQTGQKVEENTVLGKIGNTGFSTGKHLHYEISVANEKINPSIITAIAKNVQ